MAKREFKDYVIIALVIGLILFYISPINTKKTIDSALEKVTKYPTNSTSINQGRDSIFIANWNLQAFGPSKAQNVQPYVDKIKKYDIVFLQEIRDESGEAVSKLCSSLPNYKCDLSSRAGRTVAKEQYLVIYRQGISFVSLYDYNPDVSDRWERPPIDTVWQINNITYNIWNIHIKPDDAQQEIQYLSELVGNSSHTIILGDMNADCDYFTRTTEFNDYNWVIPDTADTTVSNTNCAYDRIIASTDVPIKSYDIDKSITSGLSDHYIISVVV